MGDKEQDQSVQADPPSEVEPELPFGESEWEQRGGWPDVELKQR